MDAKLAVGLSVAGILVAAGSAAAVNARVLESHTCALYPTQEASLEEAQAARGRRPRAAEDQQKLSSRG